MFPYPWGQPLKMALTGRIFRVLSRLRLKIIDIKSAECLILCVSTQVMEDVQREDTGWKLCSLTNGMRVFDELQATEKAVPCLKVEPRLFVRDFCARVFFSHSYAVLLGVRSGPGRPRRYL